MSCIILRLRAPVLFLLIAGVVWPAAAVRAAVLRYLSLEDQCERAKIIVVAHAAGQSADWDDNRLRIYTDTRFEVEQTVKGGVAGVVTVRQLGGQVGEVGMSVAGSPMLAKGGRYVLFLDRRPDGKYRVVGLSQGCYPVLTDAGGKARVLPNMAAGSGARLLGRPQGQAVSARSLDEFLARIRLRLAQSR